MHMKSWASHLENTDALSFEDLPNVDNISLQNDKKKSFLNIILGFMRKVFIYWEAITLVDAITSFPNI